MRFGESEVYWRNFSGWGRGKRGEILKENFGEFCKRKFMMVGKIWDSKFWWSEVGNCKKYSCCVGEVAPPQTRKNNGFSLFLAPIKILNPGKFFRCEKWRFSLPVFRV